MRHEMNSVWYGSSDTCQMASLESFKGLTHPSDQDPSWEGSPHPKIEKNKCVLKWSLGKIQICPVLIQMQLFFSSWVYTVNP